MTQQNGTNIQQASGLLGACLIHYGMEAETAQLLRSNENEVYRIGENHVLRIHRCAQGFDTAYMTPELSQKKRIAGEMSYLAYLAEHTDIPVQKPIPNLSGELVTCLDDGTLATMLTWLAGDDLHIESLQLSDCYKIGELAGKLRLVGDEMHTCGYTPDGIYYDEALCERMCARIRAGEQAGLLTQQTCRNLCDALHIIGKGLTETSNTAGLTRVHADLSLSNILRTKKGFAPIDFSLSGYCDGIMDPASICAALEEDDRQQAALSGYTAITGHAIDLSVLDRLFAFAVLLFIASQYERFAKEEWFTAALERWQQQIFLPVCRQEPVLTPQYDAAAKHVLKELGGRLPKLLVFDLDGTLLTTDKSVSVLSQRILTECRSRGIKTAICTARPLRVSEQYLRQTDMDYIIYHNGVYLAANPRNDAPITTQHHILKPRTISLVDSEQVIRTILTEKPQCKVALEIQETLYANFAAEEFWPGVGYVETDFAAGSICWTRSMAEGVDKLVLGANTEAEAAWLYDILPSNMTCTYIEGSHCLILSKEASKGTAVWELARHLSVGIREVCCFGDDNNDIPMLTAGGIGIAMQNATDEVKKTAEAITAYTNEEGGVARFLDAVFFAYDYGEESIYGI